MGTETGPTTSRNIMKKRQTAKERYDARTAQFISLKLNKGTDADILQALEGKPKQTEIKRLIRLALNQK